MNRSYSSERGGIIGKLVALTFVAVLVGLVYLARHPLLRMAGEFWIVDETAIHADAIVVLGDDNYHADRAARAAELFKAGWAPHVVASGRFLRPYASIAELTDRDLTARGVPPSAVIRFTHRAENTREEIELLSHLAMQKGWKRLLVVTSNYHARRTKAICERTFPSGTEIRVIAAPDADFNPDNWWESRQGLKLFFHETGAYIVYAVQPRGTPQ